jgi:hypothetical protein
MPRDRRVQSHRHIRTRPARALHPERARRLRVEVLHELIVGLRIPVLRRLVLLPAVELRKAVQPHRATAQPLRMAPRHPKGGTTISHE